MVEESGKKVELKIQGMTCAMCVQTIEKSLMNLEDVSSADVNLGTETATVEYNSDKLNLEDLEIAVADAGYEVINERVTLKVGGMTCAICVQTIENTLSEVDGVIETNVNLGAEKAYVTYNPRMTSTREMKKAVEDTLEYGPSCVKSATWEAPEVSPYA